MCPPALYCCVRLCLAILYICLPALDVASSSFDFEKHKLFGVYGGVIIPMCVLLGTAGKDQLMPSHDRWGSARLLIGRSPGRTIVRLAMSSCSKHGGSS